MGECVEKIYCCDRGDNDNVLAAAILANNNNNNRYSYGDFGMNGWMNNPFAYLMFLALFRNGGFGFDGNGAAATQGVETQAQLNAIRTQLQDNQNAECIKSAVQGNGFALSQLAQTLNIDFNTLQKCCCQTQKELIQMAGDIKLQNCQMTGELRNGQRDLRQALTQGFAQSSFETKSQTCDIIKAIDDAQRRTSDMLTTKWTNDQAREIQDLKNEISQLKQTEAITAAVFARLNGHGCGCNNGCNNGCGF